MKRGALQPLPKWNQVNPKALERFARVRLVALDLDGTTVANDPPYEMVQRLVRSLAHPQHGVTVTIATGRTLTGVREVLDKLPLSRGTPMILYNGGVVVSSGRLDLIRTWNIKRAAMEELLRVATRFGLQLFAYFIQDSRQSQLEGKHEVECVRLFGCGPSEMTEPNSMPFERVELWDRSWLPAAVLLGGRAESLEGADSLLRRIGGISVTRSGGPFLEIRPADANKGAALELVADVLGVHRDETMAVGDNNNDAEMLEWAGIGVAIEGASDLALRASDFVAGYGVAQGVVEALRLVREAARYRRTIVGS